MTEIPSASRRDLHKLPLKGGFLEGPEVPSLLWSEKPTSQRLAKRPGPHLSSIAPPPRHGPQGAAWSRGAAACPQNGWVVKSTPTPRGRPHRSAASGVNEEAEKSPRRWDLPAVRCRITQRGRREKAQHILNLGELSSSLRFSSA